MPGPVFILFKACYTVAVVIIQFESRKECLKEALRAQYDDLVFLRHIKP